MDRRMVEYEAKKQTPLVAYILLVVFGVVGAHNFYLGRRGQALAQRVAKGLNPGRKSSNYLQGCTICVSCHCTGSCWNELPERENRASMAGVVAPDLDAESRSAGCSFMALQSTSTYESAPDPSSSHQEAMGSPAGLTLSQGRGTTGSATHGDGTSACLTAFGSCLIMRRSAAAGPLTRRLPCSHFR